MLLLPVVVALAVIAIAVLRSGRRQALARMRALWGQHVERPRNLDRIERSLASRVAAEGTRTALDDRTWADLNLDEVFVAIDHTQSTLGQQALYHRLRTAPVGDELAAFDALAARMGADTAARERAQLALDRLQDPQGYDLWWLREFAAQPRWYVVFPFLTASTIAAVAALPFVSAAKIGVVVILVVNLIVRYATDARVGALGRSFRQFAPLIATAESLAFLEGADIEPIVRPLRADVPQLKRLKTISRWVNGDPFLLPPTQNLLVTMVSDTVTSIYEYLNLGFLTDATGAYFSAKDIASHGHSLVRAVVAAGDVDAALSVAAYRASRQQWCRPDFRAQGLNAALTDVRHPLVDDAVPNSIVLRPGSGLLVTGSNMSGKSTFLRTVGVNVVLAQTIHTCLASSYQAPVFTVRSCIGRADDLIAGKSYYLVEVEALLELVRASGDDSTQLFLLDELFRGTNAVERIAAGQAVLEELIGPTPHSKPHVVIAATHDGELVDLLPETFETVHFGDAIGPDGLVFDHLLQPGPATTRTAIALLRQHGAPETLLRRAIETAALLDRQRGTSLTVS